MEYKLKMTPDEVIESIAHSVSYAKSFCSDVEFSAEDATRTDLDFLCRVVETAIKAGATTINIPDTVGYMIPEEYAARIKYLARAHHRHRKHRSVLSYAQRPRHGGCELARGRPQRASTQVECTINGIGERAGNASMEEMRHGAQDPRPDHFGIETAISNTTQIYRSSKPHDSDHHRRCPLPPTKAIVGANAFAHEAGIHQHGVMANARKPTRS